MLLQASLWEDPRSNKETEENRMMRLYHQPGSRSNRVLWALEESGVPFDVTLITRDEKKTPEYLAIHPLGRSPGFETEEGPLFESTALCLHVADVSTTGLNFPLGSHERALVYQWTAFAMTELEPPASAAWAAWRASDPDGVTAAGERFRTAAQVVENALDGTEFLVGGRFTVADLMCGDTLSWGKGEAFDLLEEMPKVQAYLVRLEARPAYERAMAKAPA
jgi:glutathione S-transferase